MMNKKVYFLLLASVTFLFSCAHNNSKVLTTNSENQNGREQDPELMTVTLHNMISNVEKNLKDRDTVIIDGSDNEDSEQAESTNVGVKEDVKVKYDDPKIALDMNNRVYKWIEYFTTRDRERFQRFLDRGERFRDVVQTILNDNGLPVELYYLAMIESGYTTYAKSRAKAVGAWQFMRPTAKRYGLISNSIVDERKDPIRSTEAAAKYLSDLYGIFQSWELAMAAYNCGEGRVAKAIVKGKSSNYWDLVDQGYLPKETRNYVPKFVAAVLIGKDPEKYGFILPENREKVFPSVEAIEVPASIKLDEVASLANIMPEVLHEVNPHLKKGITPPISSSYEIWVPQEKVSDVEKIKNLLRPVKVNWKKEIASEKRIYNQHYHKVGEGESLWSLAQRYQVSVYYLKKINNLKSSQIHPGQQLRITAKAYLAKDSGQFHRIKKGDTLEKISKKYKVTIESLKKINQLRNSKLAIGEKLLIPENKG